MFNTAALAPHLTELRRRALWVLGAWAGAAVLAFVWRMPLLAWLVAPATPHLGGTGLLATGVMEIWLVHLHVSLLAGALLALPLGLYHAWVFLAPGLTPPERTRLRQLAGAALGLLLLGLLLARYALLPAAFSFLLGVAQPGVTIAPRLSDVVHLSLTFMLLTALLCTFPLGLWALVRSGVLSAVAVRAQRRPAIIVMLLATALLTPSPDPLTMILLAGPMYLLCEGAVWLAKPRKIKL